MLDVVSMGFDKRFETVCTSNQSKQRKCLEVYTAVLCGEGHVTSRLCDDLSTQLHLRVSDWLLAAFGTRRSVTDSPPMQRKLLRVLSIPPDVAPQMNALLLGRADAAATAAALFRGISRGLG